MASCRAEVLRLQHHCSLRCPFQPCNTFIASMNTLVSDTPSSLSTEGIRGRSLTTVPCPYGDLTACRSLTTAWDTSFDAIWRPSPRRSLYDCGIGGTSVVLQLTSHGRESNNCPFSLPGDSFTLQRCRETGRALFPFGMIGVSVADHSALYHTPALCKL